MIERLRDLPDGVDGLRASSKVTREDYERAVEPLFDEARREGRRIRLLYQFGPDFEGFTAGGMWDDVQLGLQYLRLFERCAIVSDVEWIGQVSRLFGTMVPFPVRHFRNTELEAALSFLRAPVAGPTVPHRLLSDVGVLIVEPERPLRREDFEAVAMTVDPWLEAHGRLQGVVIHAREFPGWENLGGFLRHLRFLRDHQRKVRHVAVAVDGRLAQIAPKLVEHFVEAEVRHFPYDQLAAAVEWARAAGT